MALHFIRAPRVGACKTHRGWATRHVAVLALLVAPVFAMAAGVSVRFDFSSTATTPFPSDRFTQVDFSQNTFKRVALPKPDCAVRPSDCADIDVINTLDGFNTQPRITVPFTGAIDVKTVTSDTVFLVNLGDTLSGAGFGQRVGVNQVSFNQVPSDPTVNTLVVESDELLNQHSRYLLVITDGVHDAAGDPIEGRGFERFLKEPGDRDEQGRNLMGYQKAIKDAELSARSARHRIVGLSLFTTQSVSADLQKIHAQIKHSHPAPVNFMIGNGGSTRAVFPFANVTGIEWVRQTGTAPTFALPSVVPTKALSVVPGSVGRIAYGKFRSPDYETAAKYIPATGTLTGEPAVQGSNELVFELFLPSGPRPAGGWPVAIFGHGFGNSLYDTPWTVPSVLASKGIATIAIHVVGHGFGPLSTLNVMQTVGAPVAVPAGGRGIDQDGNGRIDSTEGSSAAPPRTVIGSRDGLRQTVVDLMQLVRQIQAGIDVDGDGSVDLDREHIYFFGHSFGGIYGTIFLAVEEAVKAGVPNVPGGSIPEVVRLGGFRFLLATGLATRQPQLLNLPSAPGTFNENIPLRNQPPLINTVPGSSAIQLVIENSEWVEQSGNPVTYAPFIRKQPLHGHSATPVIIQFAKGDTTVPNPTTTAILRAGELADRATYFRNDLAFAATGGKSPKNPHGFLVNIANPFAAPFAVMAQTQIAVFFASDGTVVIDPDMSAPIFEWPIVPPLPETLNFLP